MELGPWMGECARGGADSRVGRISQKWILGWGLIREGGSLFKGGAFFEDSRYCTVLANNVFLSNSVYSIQPAL